MTFFRRMCVWIAVITCIVSVYLLYYANVELAAYTARGLSGGDWLREVSAPRWIPFFDTVTVWELAAASWAMPWIPLGTAGFFGACLLASGGNLGGRDWTVRGLAALVLFWFLGGLGFQLVTLAAVGVEYRSFFAHSALLAMVLFGIAASTVAYLTVWSAYRTEHAHAAYL